MTEICLNYLHKSHAKVTPQFHNTFTEREREREREEKRERSLALNQVLNCVPAGLCMAPCMLSRSHTLTL